MKKILATTAIMFALATPAFATNYTFTDVGTAYSDNAGIVNVPGYSAPWTTPIIFTGPAGSITSFCDDMEHDVYVEGGQNLAYHTGPVTVDGLGHPLSEATSNIMGQITTIGLNDYRHGNENAAIAAQAAVWGEEYHINVTSSNPIIESYITSFYGIHDNGHGWANGLINNNGVQNQILGGGVPEIPTCMMFLTGILALTWVALPRKKSYQVTL